jgi:uncharacterized protein YrrD
MIKLMKNAEVFSSKGEKIGLLDRVVLDPETKQVSHIVVEKGIIFSTSKVIPISYVNLGGERITLTEDAMELEDLPDFIETSYISTTQANDPEQIVDAIYFYPPQHVAWWRTGGRIWYPKQRYVLKTMKSIPEDMVALEEGAKVFGRDGEEIGNLEEVIVESSEKRATHIVVSRGFFSAEHKLIPTLWITDVVEKEVYLSIDSELFEHLPEFKLA